MSSAAVVVGALRVKEWTGIVFASSVRAPKTGQARWNGIIVKSPVVGDLAGYGIE